MKRDQPEYRLQCAVAAVLWARAKPGVFWTALPFGEKRTAKTGARLKRMGVRPGAGDLLLAKADKPPMMLELKVGKNTQAPSQKETQAAWEAAGGFYEVAWGYKQAIECLEAWGLLRPDHSLISFKQEELALEPVV